MSKKPKKKPEPATEPAVWTVPHQSMRAVTSAAQVLVILRLLQDRAALLEQTCRRSPDEAQAALERCGGNARLLRHTCDAYDLIGEMEDSILTVAERLEKWRTA